MTLKQCYAALGGDYEGVLGRLCSEQLVRKFVLKFPADGSFMQLKASLASGDAAEAFRAAHTLKGVCANLGFTMLGDSSSALTEALRGGSLDGSDKLFAAVERDYAATVSAIAEFEKNQ